MTLIFADTSYFVAAISPRDAHHDRANALMHDYSGNVVTTDFVIVELGNYLRRLTDRSSFAPIWSSIRNDPQFEVVEASRRLLDLGIQLFVNRPDKKWSLTDCISFVVMRDYSVTDALTSDDHFEQAGFKALLRF
jgi:predicted nucleic acid-binding protein